MMMDDDENSGAARARQMLRLAGWAAQAYARYDLASVRRIASAVAEAAAGSAANYARSALRENGFGTVEAEATANLLASRGVLASYGEQDYVSARVDLARGLVELPRPVGVVVGQFGSAGGVATVFDLVLLALLTRNALVLSPDSPAGQSGSDAAVRLAAVAVAAGAPAGVIQVAEASAVARAALLEDGRADLVITAEIPGNVPVLVDSTADLEQAAVNLLASKAFGNSALAGSESVLIVQESVAGELLAALRRNGAYVLADAERDALRAVLFRHDRFDQALLGREAGLIAERAGISVPPGTQVLLAPVNQVLTEEPLAHRKPCPVLGVVQVPDQARGIRAAIAVVRLGEAPRAAVIHSRDPQTVLDYAATLGVPRVVVNQGGSPSEAELSPDRLIRWTQVAYPETDLTDLTGAQPSRSTPRPPVPSYPLASNLVDQ